MTVLPHKDGFLVNTYFGDLHPEGKRRLTRVIRPLPGESKRDTRRRAVDAEREWEDWKDRLRGIGGSLTVSAWRDEWLRRREADLRGSTYDTYRHALAPFVREHGDTSLTEVSSTVARQWCALHPKGQADVLKNFFGGAVDGGLLDHNPFADVRSTKPKMRAKAAFHDTWPLDPIKQRELLTTIAGKARGLGERGPEIAAMVLFSAWTGCRPGEVRGLKREDMDLTNDRAFIRRVIDTRNEERAGTKNHLHREIIVPPIDDLRDALSAMPSRLTTDYIFTNIGKRWTAGAFNPYWDKIRERAGTPSMRYYDLRHFCATQLLEMGLTPEDVAVQLGHTDGGALVRRVYGHPSEDLARERIRHTLANNFPTDSSHTRNTETHKVRRIRGL